MPDYDGYFIGVNGAAITKTAAMEHLGISKDEIVVFGDGENDLSMFQAAKYSVAMGNAMETVKQAAIGSLLVFCRPLHWKPVLIAVIVFG